MTEKPSYYSIIPAIVRYDKDLTPNAKLLYAEITSLCNMNGTCNASTEYFCKLYQVSKASVQNCLKILEDKGFIGIEVVYKKGSKEILTRYIKILDYPSKEILTTPSKEILIDNITSNKLLDKNINLTDSNNITPTPLKSEKENLDFIQDELKPVYQEWLKYRKEIKKPLKETSIKANYNQLLRLANNDIDTAKAIINQSIANGWQGLFEIKQQNYLKPKGNYNNFNGSYGNDIPL